MLTNQQKSLIKRAQRQAHIPDDEYREVLETVTGVRSSTDPTIGDDHLDVLMGYMEAIYWAKVDAGLVAHAPDSHSPFQRRGYWKAKNPRGNTSRQRFSSRRLQGEIADLEAELEELGYGHNYCAGIAGKCHNNPLHYRSAMRRTLRSIANNHAAEHAQPVEG